MSLWLSRAWNRSKVLGTDGMRLLLLVAQNPTRRVRDTVVSAARSATRANAAAVQILHLEQEVNLMRYHGLQWYWDERARHIIPTSSLTLKPTSPQSGSQPSVSSSYSTASRNDDVPPETPRGARVAFMITSSQRVELRERLGYGEPTIKRLTPKAAALILEQSIHVTDITSSSSQDESSDRTTKVGMDTELVDAIRKAVAVSASFESTNPQPPPKHHAEDAIDSEVPTEQPTQKEPTKLALSVVQSSTEEDSSNHLSTNNGTPFTPSAPVVKMGHVEPSSSAQDDVPRRKWFQVTERKLDGSNGTAVVGLFSNEEEAQMCLDTKRHQASKHGRKAMFQIERVER